MNGISHKQAIQFINRRLDGILTENQNTVLDEHLRSCDSCHTYSNEMESLPAHLTYEFQSRWDKKLGISQNVIGNIAGKARRIPVANRVFSNLRMLAGAIALILLAFAINLVIRQMQNVTPLSPVTAPTVSSSANLGVAPQVDSSSLIAFVAAGKDDALDIYTVHADGSDLTNITNSPDGDVMPAWSPDGSRIAFVSNRDGNANIYMMNADGSDVIRLTDDPETDNTPIWSPDGTKIAYTSGDFNLNDTDIFVINADGKNQHRVTDYDPGTVVFPRAWSSDSQYVFFNADGQIMQADVNGSAIDPVSPKTETNTDNYVVAKDGSAFSYLTECNESDTTFCYRLRSIRRDETQPDFTQWQASFKTPRSVCPVKQTSTWMGSYIKWSPDQTKILFIFTCEDEGWIYIANADGSEFKSLTNYPLIRPAIDNGAATGDWSADSQSIVFLSASDQAKNYGLYILNVNNALQDPEIRPTPLNTLDSPIWSPVWQPKINAETTDKQPIVAAKPVDRLIAFTLDLAGNRDIYTVHADGSGLTNLTDNPARDANPVWSPDGKRIAFESDRDGGNPSQIFLMNADGSNITPLTTDDGDHMLPSTTNSKTNLWSPDGNQLLYMQMGRSDTEWTLQSIDINTGDITSLGTGKVDINHISWSPDGKHIAFIHNDPKNTDDNKYIPQMQIVRADGTNLTTIAMPSEEGLNIPINYYWSRDGQSISFLASNVPTEGSTSFGSESGNPYYWKIYEVDLDGTLTLQTTTHSPIGGWWNGTYFLAGSSMMSSSPAFTWVQQKGAITSFNPLKNCQDLLDSNTGGYIKGYSSYKQSSNGNVVIGAYCPNGDKWLFWANAKGKVSPLLNSPIHVDGNTSDAMDLWAPADFVWSPDDKYVAFNIFSAGKTDMYVVNVAEALKDPSILPLRITIGDGSLYYSPSWHPFIP